jgi:hypothetical protein
MTESSTSKKHLSTLEFSIVQSVQDDLYYVFNLDDSLILNQGFSTEEAAEAAALKMLNHQNSATSQKDTLMVSRRNPPKIRPIIC